MKQGRVVGLGRHHRDRQDGPWAGKFDPKRPNEAGQDQQRLREREMRADADARPDPEGQIRVTRHRRRSRQEPPRIERIRRAPEPPVPVQDPRRDQDQITRGDRTLRHLVRRPRGAHDHECRRIKPHRLLDHGSGQDQMRRIDPLPFARDLVGNPVLHVGSQREQIHRPE